MGFNKSILASSYWGLEHRFCEELSRERKNRIQEAWDAVLEEQDYQLEYDEFSPERLAQLYQDVTRESRLEAYRQARRYREELLEDEQAYLPYNESIHVSDLYRIPA